MPLPSLGTRIALMIRSVDEEFLAELGSHLFLPLQEGRDLGLERFLCGILPGDVQYLRQIILLRVDDFLKLTQLL